MTMYFMIPSIISNTCSISLFLSHVYGFASLNPKKASFDKVSLCWARFIESYIFAFIFSPKFCVLINVPM